MILYTLNTGNQRKNIYIYSRTKYTVSYILMYTHFVRVLVLILPDHE